MRTLSITLALLTTPLAAPASTVLGNPTSEVVLTDGNGVYVQDIVAVECGSQDQHTFSINTLLNQSQHADVDFNETDYCDVTVYLRWTSASALEAVPVSGFNTLSISGIADPVSIDLDATQETATLTQ